MTVSMWICLIGAGVFVLCKLITGTTDLVTRLLDAAGKLAFAMFWCGLLAWVWGK